MHESQQDRRALHVEVREVFSHVGDIRTVLSLMAVQLMNENPQLNVIKDLLKRKAGE